MTYNGLGELKVTIEAHTRHSAECLRAYRASLSAFDCVRPLGNAEAMVKLHFRPGKLLRHVQAVCS